MNTSINEIYRQEVEGTKPTDERLTASEIANDNIKYRERFEVWSNDATSHIIISELAKRRGEALKLSLSLASLGEEKELRANNTTVNVLTRVLNLMTTGEYKL